MTKEEIWKPIPGFEGYYSISNMGRARSEARTLTRTDGTPLPIKERILKPSKDGKGYLVISARKNNKTKFIHIHQAIMWAFVGPQEKGIEVRHNDGVPLHNTLDNLCYGTKAQNIEDAKKHGTFPLLERRPGAKLTRALAREICQRSETADVLAKEYGISPITIMQVRTGRTWASVTGDVRQSSYKRKGEKHHGAKLTAEDARAIFVSSESQRALAKRYGVDKATIQHIKQGKIWKHAINP